MLFQLCLDDSNFGAADAAAGEVADFAAGEGDNTVTGSVDGEVTAQLGAVAGALRQADLADDYLADRDFLATRNFDAEALAGTISSIFGSTASFYM